MTLLHSSLRQFLTFLFLVQEIQESFQNKVFEIQITKSSYREFFLFFKLNVQIHFKSFRPYGTSGCGDSLSFEPAWESERCEFQSRPSGPRDRRGLGGSRTPRAARVFGKNGIDRDAGRALRGLATARAVAEAIGKTKSCPDPRHQRYDE